MMRARPAEAPDAPIRKLVGQASGLTLDRTTVGLRVILANTGVTNDLERRAAEHKEGMRGSFTARYNVNRLMYFEHFTDIEQAIAREKEVKSMTRRRKINLMESMNPDLRDLSGDSEAQAGESGIPRAAATRGNDIGGEPG